MWTAEVEALRELVPTASLGKCPSGVFDAETLSVLATGTGSDTSGVRIASEIGTATEGFASPVTDVDAAITRPTGFVPSAATAWFVVACIGVSEAGP